MAVDVQNYVVTREVALRTGEIANKYRTADGRFIVDNRTLTKIQFTSDEIVNGLSGVEKITKRDALTLIAQGGYRMGDSEEAVRDAAGYEELTAEAPVPDVEPDEEAVGETPEEEAADNNEEETENENEEQ